MYSAIEKKRFYTQKQNKWEFLKSFCFSLRKIKIEAERGFCYSKPS